MSDDTTSPSSRVLAAYDDLRPGPYHNADLTESGTSSPRQATALLLAGVEEVKFVAHPHKLRHIAFFRACLDSSMQESQTNTIRMPEDGPVAVAHVLNSAYAGKVDFDLTGQCRIQRNDKTAPPVQVDIAMDTYRLAKKYQIEPLQNLMVDQLVNCYKVMKPSVAAFRRTLEVTEEGDGLREFMMHLFSHRVEAKGGWEAIKASQHKYYTDFALRDIESMEFALEGLLKVPWRAARPLDYAS